MSGSNDLWGLGEALGIVPAPPDSKTAGLLLDWWSSPRQFGCPHVTPEEWWVVVAPDRRIWCPACADARFQEERRCFSVTDCCGLVAVKCWQRR